MSITLSVLACALASTLAQTTTPTAPAAAAPGRSWMFAVARDAIALREVPQSGRPIETSPVRLQGTGTRLHAGYRIERGSRAHLMSVAATPSFSGFALVSPITSVEAAADRASELGARYEYRRYLLRDVFVPGLDVGAGVLAHGTRRVIERRVAPSNGITSTDLEGGGGLSAGVRLTRWPRLRIDAGVAALAVMGRNREVHDIDPAATLDQTGGGWLIETTVSATAQVSSSFGLVGTYEGTGQMRYAARRGHSERRARLAIGVTYAR